MTRTLSPLRLNFHKSQAGRRRLNGAWLVLAVILIVVPIMYHRQIVRDTARLEQDSAVLAISSVSPVVLSAMKGDGSNKMLEQLNAPWETLLNGLEIATDDKVALLSMQPNLARGEALLLGEAARYADVLDYIERLKAQPGFMQAYLTNHTIAEDTPGKPVRFAITLQWEAAP
ncbi:hypothetical protein A7976_10560 [Methylobacillus sp. MM3]|jgi:hypothetical protein|uniref:PilN domain-containing protein n=1 Tax=Methylobacillus sp. MM3 TaxID=1848039 RepID=UPI0007E1B9F3|nr:PilN domain-containing protein [Methylobacillus sp. MM3]OAJ71885.1 hypothetical protein A7976_10560 [Methylobacillus sp. MM3]